MRTTKNIFMLLLATIACINCSPEDPIESSVTYYPELELLGDQIMTVELNTEFDDPEIIAIIDGEEVPYEVSSNIDTSTPGLYSVTYSAENNEGYSSSITRTVIVYESNGSIAGYWLGTTDTYTSPNPVLITTTDDPTIFNITDVLAGHYEYGAGYGPAYAVPSTITVEDGSISSPGGPNAFGTWSVNGATLSSDQRTMSWTATLVEQAFTITGIQLEKVTP